MYECFEYGEITPKNIKQIIKGMYNAFNRNHVKTMILGYYEELDRELSKLGLCYEFFKLNEEPELPTEGNWNLMLLDPSPELFSHPGLLHYLEAVPKEGFVVMVLRTTKPVLNGREPIELDRLTESEKRKYRKSDSRVLQPYHCPYREESLEVQNYLYQNFYLRMSEPLKCRSTRRDDEWPNDYSLFLLDKSMRTMNRPIAYQTVVTGVINNPDGTTYIRVENSSFFPASGALWAIDDRGNKEKIIYSGRENNEIMVTNRGYSNTPQIALNPGTIIEKFVPHVEPRRFGPISAVPIPILLQRQMENSK